MKLKLFSLLKKQAGFTLLEFIIGISIMGLLGTGILAATTQTITGGARNRDQMQAVQQVENVGYWITRDAQMAKTITVGTSTAQMTWYDDAGNTYAVTYSIVSGTKVQRSYVVNGGTAVQTILASSINPSTSLTTCTYSGGILTAKITATVGRATETRIYQIKNRPVVSAP